MITVVAAGWPKFIFGVPQEKRIMIDAIPPNSRVRYRFRNKGFAEVFVREPGRLRVFNLVERTPEYWGMENEHGRNETL